MIKKASIIIPCYNTAENIGRTLQAFIEQTQPAKAYEIIVIDDCSTDQTVAEIRKKVEAPQLIFLQNEQNSGPAHTRNRGIDQASGEIIIFSDGDTVPGMGYVEKHLETHIRYSEPYFVVSGAAAMPEDIEITPLMYLGNVVQTMGAAEYVEDDPYDWLHFSTLNVSLKSEFLADSRFDEGSFVRKTDSETELAGFEDTELAQRLAKKGMKLVYNPNILAYHYHFRSPEDYLNKVHEYGKRFRVWISLCPPEEASELQLRMNYLLDRKSILSSRNLWECFRRLLVNDLSFPAIKRAAKFFENRNERLSLFLYQKVYKYLFLKGYFSK